MKLIDVKKSKWYLVQELSAEDLELRSRFYKLGIFPGAKVMLKRTAPLFGDPLLFQVDDTQVVMSKVEASSVTVSELN